MRWLISLTLLVGFGATAGAHHPDRENQPVHQRIDLIGPMGTWLPPSHRRAYNRPTYWGGKIAYLIAPSSQEAMAWHDAAHRGHYQNHRPRIEKHFFYPKPWEALEIGARVPHNPQMIDGNYPVMESLDESGENSAPTEPATLAPLVDDPDLIEK